MDPQNPASGVPASPAAPVASATAEPQAPQTPTAPPTGSEPVTNTGSGQPEGQSVPFDRFQEVNNKAKTAEEENERLRQELEQVRQQPSSKPSVDGDDDLDPDVEDIIRRGAKKLGLVSQDELDSRDLRTQVLQDVKDLESTYGNSGVPYEHNAVMKYANDNNMPVTSKAALRAAYRELNWDKIVEAERQGAITQFKENGSSGAERPGSSGNQSPQDPTPVQGTKNRIKAARQRLRI